MSKRKQQVSLADAREHLGEVVEQSKIAAVELTRRGKTVAYIVSAEEYARRPAVWDAIQNWRNEAEGEEDFFEEDPFADKDKNKKERAAR